MRPGDRVLDACCGTGDLAVAARSSGATVTGLDFSPRMLERARRKDAVDRVGRGRPARAAVRGRLVRLGDGRLRRPQRRRPRARAARAAARARARTGGSRSSRSRSRSGVLAPFYRALVRPDRPAARQAPEGRRGLHLPAGERAPLPRPGGAGGADARGRASTTSSTGRSRAGSSRCTRGVSHEQRARRRSGRHPGSTSTSSELEERLAGDGRSHGGARRRGLARRAHAPAASGCARCSSSSPPPPGERASVAAGVAVELVHMATLVHDDLIDGAEFRRGRASAWSAYGPERRAGDRRLPVRAGVCRAGRDRRRAAPSPGSPTPRSASPAARRCSAARRTTRTRRSRRISSAAG